MNSFIGINVISKTAMNGYWECIYCTYINDFNRNCLMCNAWVCDKCTYNNNSKLTQCSVCDSVKSEEVNGELEENVEKGPTVKSLRDAALAAGEKLECECETGAYCNNHDRVMIFQEYPVKPTSDYPDINNMRFIGSISPCWRVFEMINGPVVSKMMTCDFTQSIAGTSITITSKYNTTNFVITKTIFGLEAYGPTISVMKKLYNHVMKTSHPVSIEVSIADGTNDTKSDQGCYSSHGIILAIIPGGWVSKKFNSTRNYINKMFPDKSNVDKLGLGKIYIVDANSSSEIANHNSQEIEAAIRHLLPIDDRFVFIPQKVWLDEKLFHINGSYESIGISSGWCRTISILIAGMIMRRDMPKHPEDVLEYIASFSAHRRIIMYEAVIRHVVAHIYTVDECKKLLADRQEKARKYQESLKIRPAGTTPN